ncbi:MAG: hypothetical protein NC321_01475 [Clostridium sp.]|nr:hypothetical protein [Clostridium sp.]
MMITGAAILRKIWAEVKKSSEKFFEGDVILSKRECWLIGAILVLVGVAVGLIHAPLTHGINITIGSNNTDNGSRNGNHGIDTDDDVEKE